ncbi:hypothetical protein ACFBZI_01575 [Moraxella sp. ZJ142]|uniref:hypothetical protein n=1 Tax=Moraxella marmotae TaxID=3344520 RepID=UPI0035D3DAD1
MPYQHTWRAKFETLTDAQDAYQSAKYQQQAMLLSENCTQKRRHFGRLQLYYFIETISNIKY